MTDEKKPDGNGLKDWVNLTAYNSTIAGYRPVPVYEGNTTAGYGKGQRYDDYRTAEWSANHEALPIQHVALALDDCILVDYDGNKAKGDILTVDQLAGMMGITTEVLRSAQVQSNVDGDSLHFLFRVDCPATVEAIRTKHLFKMSNDGHWIQHIDVKTANQLMHIKRGKVLTLPVKSELVTAPPALIDVLRVAESAHVVGEYAVCDTEDPSAVAWLAQDCAELAKMVDGEGRNNTFNDITLLHMGRVASGYLDKIKTQSILVDAAYACGLSSTEITATMGSASRSAKPVSSVAVHPDVQRANAIALMSQAFEAEGGSVPMLSKQGVPVARNTHKMMDPTQQIEYFKGCTHVSGDNCVLMPDGCKIKPDAFKDSMGGHTFMFNDATDKNVEKNAYKVFTQSELIKFPHARYTTFDADGSFGDICIEGGVEKVNEYKPAPGRRAVGDASVFLNHVAKLLPDTGDQKILLDWMAVKVQSPGKVMRWAPVLVGCPGNGKTTIADIVKYAIGKYTVVVQSGDIDNKFNGWAYASLFAIVNDFKVGDKRDVMETLKPMVTDKEIPIQLKGKDSIDTKNHLGIMITTNHKDGVVKTADDRRYAVFHTGQQSIDDKRRDGMTDSYFDTLHAWLDDEGYAIVANYLDKRVVLSHPANAPVTTSHDDAIAASMSPAQVAISDAIEDEECGFRNGVIISGAALSVLESNNIRITGKTVGNVMTELGYSPIKKRPLWGDRRHSVYVKSANTLLLDQDVTPTMILKLSGFNPKKYDENVNKGVR